jgi:hypothetical protein
MDHPSGRGDPLRGEDVTETLANVHVPGCSGVPPHMSARVAQAGADTDYRLREEAGAVVVSVTKVATGPMTEEEAAGIARFGDLTRYASAIQKLAAS